jgi:hypothetical protein
MGVSSLNHETHEVLFAAIEGFTRGNCNFESSIPVNLAVEEMGKCTSIKEVFAIPLQRQLFSMDSALRWTFFLNIAPPRAEKEGDSPFADDGFSSNDAFTLISQVYDIGVQDAIWEHFEDEDSEESEESESDEDVNVAK